MRTFIVNCGSSSIKFKLYDMADESVLASGQVERVGSTAAVLHYRSAGGVKVTSEVVAADHQAAMRHVFGQLVDPVTGVLAGLGEITGVGHRVVHAGERYSDSVLIDDEVVRVIEDHFPLSPLHNPPNLAGIRATLEAMPDTPQVAVFDTAFLATLPRRAWMYATPMEWYEKHRVRKYGFHGTSHRYITLRTAKLLGKRPDEVNLITCHLGNGCSMTAVADGAAVDHSMGMTPLAGLVMGTRSGDIDPAIVFHMMNVGGLTAAEVDRELNKNSGLLGVSGVSNDMRDLLAACDGGNERAELALEIFRYRIIHYIGAYHAILPSVDAIVFSGGIGENCRRTRAAVCEGVASLGVRLDAAANDSAVGGFEGPITTGDSRIPVWVTPTDEELMIARDTKALVDGNR